MVDRVGGALGQQWLQRLIEQAVAQNKPTDKRQGAPGSLISNLIGAGGTAARAIPGLGPITEPALGLAGAVASLPGLSEGLSDPGALGARIDDWARGGRPAPAGGVGGLAGLRAQAAGGAPGAAAGGAPGAAVGGAPTNVGLASILPGLVGGTPPADPNAPAPMQGPADYAKRVADSASAEARARIGLPPSPGQPEATPVGSGGSFSGGGVTPGGLFGIGGGNPNAVNTDAARAAGLGPAPTSLMPGGAGGAGGGAGIGGIGAGATGPIGSGMAQAETVRELLDNPAFAVQDMLRDRGINPSRNRYAGMIAQRYTPIMQELSALALAQAGIGPTSSEEQTAAAYNQFVNSLMGGKMDKQGLLRTAIASAEADPSGTMATLIRAMGPEGLAELIGKLGGQGNMLGAATQRMLGERALEARRRQQAQAEKGQVTEDDLSYLASFRGAI